MWSTWPGNECIRQRGIRQQTSWAASRQWVSRPGSWFIVHGASPSSRLRTIKIRQAGWPVGVNEETGCYGWETAVRNRPAATAWQSLGCDGLNVHQESANSQRQSPAASRQDHPHIPVIPAYSGFPRPRASHSAPQPSRTQDRPHLLQVLCVGTTNKERRALYSDCSSLTIRRQERQDKKDDRETERQTEIKKERKEERKKVELLLAQLNRILSSD